MRKSFLFPYRFLALIFLAANCAGAGNIETVETDKGKAYRLTAGNLEMTISGDNGSVNVFRFFDKAQTGKGGVYLEEATFTPAAEKSRTPKKVYRADELDRYLVRLDGKHFRGHPEIIRDIRLGYLQNDRYVLKLDVGEPFEDSQIDNLCIYSDTDKNPDSGRKDLRPGNKGIDLQVVAMENQNPPYARIWLKNGKRQKGKEVIRFCSGNSIYIIFHAGFITDEFGTSGKMQIVARKKNLKKPDVIMVNFQKELSPVEEESGPKQSMAKETAKPEFSIRKDALLITRKFNNGKVSMNVRIVPKEKYFLWEISVRNNTQESRYYRLGLNMPFMPLKEWNYWNGVSPLAQKEPKRESGYQGIGGTFPMACIYSTENGFAIGCEPFQLVATLENAVTPLEGKLRSLSFGTKLVADPGKEYHINFVLYGFGQKYGYFDAVQKYYELFPGAFNPRQGTNPLLQSPATSGLLFRYAYDPEWPEYQGDLIRRLTHGLGGWEWMYRPGYYPGDWGLMDIGKVSSSQFIPPKRAFTHDPRGPRESFDAYKNLIKQKFDASRQLACGAFYVHNYWCEEGLAQKYFPDAVIDQESNPGMRLRERWGTPGNFLMSIMLFPSGTSWAEHCRKTIAFIVKTFSPSAIAFDSAGGQERFYGPAIKNALIKAFDSKGRAYSIMGVGYAELMDFTRTLSNSRKEKVGVVPNFHQGGVFMIPFRSDAILLERHPLQWPHNYLDVFRRYRMLCGHKSISINRSFNYHYFKKYPWKKMTRQEKLDTFRMIRDHTLLFCVAFGIYPHLIFYNGVPRLYEVIPLLNELNDAGWQPSPRGKVSNEKLFVSRFGETPGELFTIINNTGKLQSGKLSVDKNRILAPYTPGLMLGEIAPSGDGETKVLLPPMSYMVFRQVASAVLPPGTKIESIFKETPFVSKKVELNVDFEKAGKMLWRFTSPKEWLIAHITVDGDKIPLSTPNNSVEYTFNSKPGRQKIIIEYVPTIRVTGDPACLAKMDFLKASPGVTIQTPAAYTDSKYLYSAWRIQEYFRYYTREVKGWKKPLSPPVKTASSDLAIVLKPEAEGTAGQIMLKPDRVIISGDRHTLPKATLKFLEMLDRKYPFCGYFKSTITGFTPTWHDKEAEDLGFNEKSVLDGNVGDTVKQNKK